MKTRGHYTTKAVDFIFLMGEAMVMYLKVLGFVALVIAGMAHADAETESRVREYFADAPVMVEIARCESKFRQTTDAGNPFYGGAGGKMVGVFQLYTDVHQDYAQSVLGYDITTLEGNLGYAKYLYQTEGTDPWISSFPCWGGDVGEETGASPAIVEDTGGLTMNLSLGMEHPQILLLQQKLNAAGYAVAAEGPGAPGQETERFGALTRAAVRAFQCAEMQICDGDEYSTGYGFVGAKTRAALVAARGAPATVSSPAGASTPAQEAEIERLRAQIAELAAILAGLLAARGS